MFDDREVKLKKEERNGKEEEEFVGDVVGWGVHMINTLINTCFSLKECQFYFKIKINLKERSSNVKQCVKLPHLLKN